MRCLKMMPVRYAAAVLAFLLVIPGLAYAAGTAPAPGSTTTYTISLGEDGTALWQVEYRTLLATDSDHALFANYTRDLQGVYLPEVQDLMQRSAAQATVATGRPMAVSNVSGTAIVQTSPTGEYGVVIYTFRWTGFGRAGTSIGIGDAFSGGMYLAKDSSLILRYPPGWTVSAVTPLPDLQQNGLTWYGLRSFAPGEPQIVLERAGSPVIPVAAGIILLIFMVTGFFLYRAYRSRAVPEQPGEEPGEPEQALSPEEEESLETRILHLLSASGGEQYQSAIVAGLGLPKSTVSTALHALHTRGLIQKVRKGRENLIRLVPDRDHPL